MLQLAGEVGEEAFEHFEQQETIYNAALLIEEGLVEGEVIRDHKGDYAAAVLQNLTSKGNDRLDDISNATNLAAPTHGSKTMKIFISHSSKDKNLAEKLSILLRNSLLLPTSEIRCTSVHGHKLKIGASTDETLRQEINSAEVFVGLITPSSISSAYVLFELGARWGAGRKILPVLARGANVPELKGPLGGISALPLSDRSDVAAFLEVVAETLSISLQPLSSYSSAIDGVLEAATNSADESLPAASATPGGSALPKKAIDTLIWLFEIDESKSSEEVAAYLGVGASEAKHYLDELVDLDFVTFTPAQTFPSVLHRSSIPRLFRLTPQGRKHTMQLRE